MATESRQVANYGTNAVAIVGKKTAYETAITTIAGMRSEIVELRPPLTLQPIRNFYRADRFKGNPSPDPMVPGMQMGGGLMHFFGDAGVLPFWLGELLMYGSTSLIGYKLPALTDPLMAAGSYTSGTAIENIPIAANQPKMQLSDDSPVMATKSGVDPISVTLPSGLGAAQLIFLFGGTATGGRKIEITGKDHNDTVLRDVIEEANIAADAASLKSKVARTMKSNYYFKDVTSIKITDTGTTPVSGTVAITGNPETYFHRLKFTKEVNEGLMIEVHEGNRNTPTTYDRSHISQGILSLQPNEVVSAAFQIFSSLVRPRESIAGATMGTDVTDNHFKRPDPDFIPDWGTSWEILESDGVPSDMVDQYRIASANFIINNMLGPPKTSFAETTTYPKVRRGGNRDLMLALQVDHHAKANFDQFVGGANFKSVLSFVSRGYGQRYQAIRCIGENTQLTNFPSRPLLDFAEVIANLALRMNIGNAADGNDELTIEIFNDSATL
ncbi:MAG: hypothetical protein OXL96_28240 [Candidatus Poribacteria bacterium]|nr:hypothetical protein [Candidatus Poribacteria bacterium]